LAFEDLLRSGGGLDVDVSCETFSCLKTVLKNLERGCLCEFRPGEQPTLRKREVLAEGGRGRNFT